MPPLFGNKIRRQPDCAGPQGFRNVSERFIKVFIGKQIKIEVSD
jgi:hypothetical protein